ncbi:hypothetical protein FIBSPDRAFT_827195 [Athelia psychrophila]|uniref:Btz domain-containing protein n=1 Tax=Athelia psychrophila TaxID=1759441 RepID=A0A166ISE0_9AGAM|nr:hypothetical protein FIBSPDRAFT_827195 [Fibularhizoctonia sp. CBS 109695]
MPTPVALPPTTHTSNKSNGSKAARASAPIRSKKAHIGRRRGRAKDGLESDDEIEREARTDSDTDDDQSSVESASDSDTEPASEDVLPNGQSRVLTPNLTQTSGDVVPDSHGPTATKVADGRDAFFGSTPGNWSEMVADEGANGPADLPVIDFADFNSHPVPQKQPRKASKAAKKAPVPIVPKSPVSAASPLAQEGELDEEPVASTSQEPPVPAQRRAPGTTVRQAYQERLKDPSYVPTVGEFWGHDDRLLDKGLRSLSGWWRGRWEGRGARGRGGFDRGFVRGRGRGGFSGPQSQGGATNEEGLHDESAPEIKPPVDRAWTHDGFEEMKRREDSHRSNFAPPPRGGPSFRGGRGATAHGGRGRGGFSRGGFNATPSVSSPSAPPTTRARVDAQPEQVWTREHDGFLHLDFTSKPHSNQSRTVHVNLPGISTGAIEVHLKARNTKTSGVAPGQSARVDEGERIYMVRIPKRAGKEKAVEQNIATEPVTTVDAPPIDDALTVRVRKSDSTLTTTDIAVSTLAATSSPPAVEPPQDLRFQPESVPQSLPDQTQPEPPQQASSPLSADFRPLPSSLPPIQTSFTPIPQVSPRYGSPFGFPPPLPPGVAMNQQGLPYEMSTGRAIYYQPQPQPVYNPRPVMHTHMAPPGIPFVPGHMHQLSAASPDFAPPSHTPPVNGFIDPSTGAPLFSMPRHSSRVEIRAPSESGDKPSPNNVRRPSGLRTTATAFEPQYSANGSAQPQPYYSEPAAQPNGHYMAEPGMQGGQQQGMDPSMMGYPPYQQQYYYPAEGYGGYGQYVDMSQPSYEMYPADPHANPPAVYY